jgi:hypothetical protein
VTYDYKTDDETVALGPAADEYRARIENQFQTEITELLNAERASFEAISIDSPAPKPGE